MKRYFLSISHGNNFRKFAFQSFSQGFSFAKMAKKRESFSPREFLPVTYFYQIVSVLSKFLHLFLYVDGPDLANGFVSHQVYSLSQVKKDVITDLELH